MKTIGEIDPKVNSVLLRIVSRFFNLRQGTSVWQTRTGLLEKRNDLSELMAAGYLKIVGAEYFPTFKLANEIAPDISRLAVGEVKAVLAALRNLYMQQEGRNEFSVEEIIAAVRVLSPGLDRKDVVPGLFL